MASIPLSRRRFVAGSGLAITALALPACPRAIAETASDGFQVLRARQGTAALRGADKAATPIRGYDGIVPGPAIRARRGEEVKVRLVNELPEPTTMHWHGVRAANAMDGMPHLTQPPIAPGASFDYRFTPRDAGTYWYHPPWHSSSHRGLAGPLIIEDTEPADVDREVLLCFQDWRLNADGTIDAARGGESADLFSVNGHDALDIPVKTNERLRLRLINAGGRFIAVRLDNHRPVVMAIDGQPAEPFPARDGRIVLAPGNRVDLFVDAVLEPGTRAAILIGTPTSEAPIATLLYGPGPRPGVRPEAKSLPPNPLPGRLEFRGAFRAELPIVAAPPEPAWGPPLFQVKRGRVILLTLSNRTPALRAVHIHGHHVRLLDNLDDGWKPFWLDTIPVPPERPTRVAFLADNPGKWAIEVHGGEAAKALPATWFEVT